MRNFKDGSFVIGIDPVGFCTDQVHMGMYINPTGGLVTFSIVQGKMDTDSINGYLLKYKLGMMGEALVWEYLRNVGIDGVKPDTHYQTVFKRKPDGRTNSSISGIYGGCI